MRKQTLKTLNFDGLQVSAFRSEIDGRLCVSIDSSALAAADVHAGGDEVPNIRISVNDDWQHLEADGGYVRRPANPPAESVWALGWLRSCCCGAEVVGYDTVPRKWSQTEPEGDDGPKFFDDGLIPDACSPTVWQCSGCGQPVEVTQEVSYE